MAANKTVRLKSREQVASTQTELRDWNRWEPTELREDQRPFSTDGMSDLTQSEHRSKS